MMIRKVSLKRRARSGQPGKCGIVRRYGRDMSALRSNCWDRCRGLCEDCFSAMFFNPRFDGDPRAYDMAHIKSRGAGGSDVLENVRGLCHSCHMKEHTKGKR
jgi:5-methylcytosine-specific restriction endonuclease McrA